ncbi:ABC-2 family transporter protein [uncultured archaeon]|nr:ABC-2 family transporter protein [uncultured archaeon]
MKLPVPGLLLLGYNECKKSIKSSITTYSWFTLIVIISTYILFSENYTDMKINRSIMAFKYGETPMTDILIFYSSSLISSVSDILPGEVPGSSFPISIGVAFFIIFPFFLGLILISKFITAKATASIAKEKEKKTLYILTVSPHTRHAIYLGKLLGIFLLTLPMIAFLYIITNWVFIVLFPVATNPGMHVLKTASITAFLFASIGLFVSVLSRDEKKASWRGLRIITAMAALTAVWIFIPFIGFVLNLTNKNIDFLPALERITFISPFTMDLVSVYNPAVAMDYFIIQLIASFIFLILGMVIFIRQDIEY